MAGLLPILSGNVQILVVSEYIQDVIRQYRPDYHSKVLTPCIEEPDVRLSSMNMKCRRESELPIKFLMAGTIQIIKGQDYFLRALDALPINYKKKIEVYFAGVPADQEMVESIQALCHTWSNATYLGLISRDKLFELYPQMDVVVCPSRDDTIPLIVPEMMMFSGIAICSTTTGISYKIENGINGFVFESGNVPELVKQMIEVIDNYEELGEIRLRARKTYEKYFTTEIFEKQLLHLFTS